MVFTCADLLRNKNRNAVGKLSGLKLDRDEVFSDTLSLECSTES
jgi:hypothetical protein